MRRNAFSKGFAIVGDQQVEGQTEEERAKDRRRLAERARRIALNIYNPDDKARLLAVAREFESEATGLEHQGPQRVSLRKPEV